MSSPLSEHSVPLRWPPSWTDSKHLEILTGTAVNCILDAPPAIAGAARARGMTAVTREEAAASVKFLPDPQWPGVRLARQSDGADAGPTGAPWVDANAWAIRLAQALEPSKRIWVEAVPEKGTVQVDASYLLAVVEPAAFGARWVIALDDSFAQALAGGETAKKDRWRKMMDAVRFFEGRPSTASLEPRANLAVISDFQGDNEFLSKEFLNMADRRNLTYRIVPKSVGLKSLPAPLSAVVYIDEQPPDAATAAVLEQFAGNGGLVIASKGSGAVAWGQSPVPSPIPGYTLKTLGKGRVAVPEKAWSDPFLVVADVRILIGRRSDVLRLFNEGTVSVQYAVGKDGSTGVIHLVNYARMKWGDPMSIAVADNFGSAQVVSLERPAPAPLKIAAQPGRFAEIPVPPFAVYSAIELRRS